jgi:hypothetical protein
MNSIDLSMDCSRETPEPPHEPRLPANGREEIRAVDSLHHNPRASVDDDLFIHLWHAHTSESRRFEGRHFEGETLGCSLRSEQFEDPVARQKEDLGFPTLADKAFLSCRRNHFLTDYTR